MPTYEFECGDLKGKADGETSGEAWRKLTKNHCGGFAKLARFRQIDRWRTVWHYQTPRGLDRAD